MFKKVLIANRGVIASRILHTLKELDIKSVVVYSDADKNLPYVELSDEKFHLPGNAAKDTYLNQDLLIEIIKANNIDAVHPGYGFLAENIEFARKLDELNVTFIAPSSKYIDLMADKSVARKEMSKYSMPIGEGSGTLPKNDEEIKDIAKNIGYPILIKPANGGGGIGMLPVYKEDDLLENIQKAKGLSEKFFSSNVVYLERYFENPRHIEFQIVADRFGNIRHLYERDCSLQRRHQKIIEESPAPNIPRDEIEEIAKRVEQTIQLIGYDNIGTVELLRDQSGQYSFLEMNTRLQVEHAVSEEVLDVDLVKIQVASAAGEKLDSLLPANIKPFGHAIEVRIYAEDPVTFYPSPGKIEEFALPQMEGIRVETGFKKGNVISPFYDPMIAKVIVHQETREKAIKKLLEFLNNTKIQGVKTNLPFLIYTLNSEEFISGNVSTGLADILVKRMKEEAKLKV